MTDRTIRYVVREWVSEWHPSKGEAELLKIVKTKLVYNWYKYAYNRKNLTCTLVKGGVT